MDWFGLISLVLNVVLSGGLIVTFVTLKSTRVTADANAKKAIAEAKADELKNVESAIKIWRDMAENMADRVEVLSVQVDKLNKEVTRLNAINTKILKAMDRITPDTFDEVIAKIKKDIQNEANEKLSDSNANADVDVLGLHDHKTS